MAYAHHIRMSILLLFLFLSGETGSAAEVGSPSKRTELYAYRLRTLPDIEKIHLFKGLAAEAAASSLSAGWHARTILTITENNTTSILPTKGGMFGMLRQAREKRDRQDIFTAQSKAEEVLILFPQTTWEKNHGNYLSDYRSCDQNGTHQKRGWSFQIHTHPSLGKNTFHIALDGIYMLDFFTLYGKPMYLETRYFPQKRKTFTLIDLDHHKAYAYRKLAHTIFSMENKTIRSFRWILGDVTENNFHPIPKSLPNSVTRFQKVGDSLHAPSTKRRKEPEFIPDPPKDPRSKFGLPPTF